MTLQFSPTVTCDKRLPIPMELNRSFTTPRGRKQHKQKPLTMEGLKELYEQRIYILYRQAVDY
jgi:hypothetical protein